MSVSPEVSVRVRATLAEIEREESCKICLAVESGSRAWGFASTDSDYDVRFIYVRRPDWYLSIDVEDKRDVIERPLNDELDLSGWDLRKALRLLRKSNPPLLEWLQCRIIYLERPSAAERIRSLVPGFYSPRATFHHYLHMAQGNFRELHGDVVWRKKYFYVLRPVLAMRWIERDLGPVPIEFERLLDATLEHAEIRAAIDNLLIEKRAGAELERGPRSLPISDFLETEIASLEGEAAKTPVASPDGAALDECFREILFDAANTPPEG